MPAVTVDDILALPRIAAPDPATAVERRVLGVTTAPGGLEGEGPLGHLLSSPTQNLVTKIHHLNFYWVLLVLIGLHILAILAYAAVKRHDLVRPMVTGKKRLPANARQPRFVSPLLALLVVLIAAGCVWALVSFA